MKLDGVDEGLSEGKGVGVYCCLRWRTEISMVCFLAGEVECMIHLQDVVYVCVEPVKEGIERGCRKVWLGKCSVGIQGVVWNSHYREFMVGLFLPKVIWSGGHSLRADWWVYHMLTV